MLPKEVSDAIKNAGDSPAERIRAAPVGADILGHKKHKDAATGLTVFLSGDGTALTEAQFLEQVVSGREAELAPPKADWPAAPKGTAKEVGAGGDAPASASEPAKGIEALKLGLDVIGVVDPTGIADLASGAISAGQGVQKLAAGEPGAAGHFVDAGISLVSAIPGGDVAKLGKLRHLAKFAPQAKKLKQERLLGRAPEIASLLDQFGGSGGGGSGFSGFLGELGGGIGGGGDGAGGASGGAAPPGGPGGGGLGSLGSLFGGGGGGAVPPGGGGGGGGTGGGALPPGGGGGGGFGPWGAILAALAALIPLLRRINRNAEKDLDLRERAGPAGQIVSGAARPFAALPGGGLIEQSAPGQAGMNFAQAGLTAGLHLGAGKAEGEVLGSFVSFTGKSAELAMDPRAILSGELALHASQLPKLLDDWGDSLLDSKRHLAEFSGAMAAVFAQEEIREISRGIESGRSIGPSAHLLVDAQQDRDDHAEPFQSAVSQGMNLGLALATRIEATALQIARFVTPIDRINDTLTRISEIIGGGDPEPGVVKFLRDLERGGDEPKVPRVPPRR